jgi:hypothetical protein
VLVQAYVDESGGKGQGTVFVFSALISSFENWVAFTPKWQACLDEPPKIAYFKMNEAASRSEQFGGFSVPERDEKVNKLCRIIATSDLVEQHTIVKLDDFSETFAKHSAGNMTDPYFFPFHITIMAIAHELFDVGHREPFEIFFDENVIFGPRAKAWYPVVRATMEPEIRAITPVEPFFRSDLEVLPLQAADLTAWLHRRENNEGLGEFSWMPAALFGLTPSRLSNALTRERMERIVGMSYDLPPEQRAIAHEVIEAYKQTFDDDWPPRRRLKPSRRKK